VPRRDFIAHAQLGLGVKRELNVSAISRLMEVRVDFADRSNDRILGREAIWNAHLEQHRESAVLSGASRQVVVPADLDLKLEVAAHYIFCSANIRPYLETEL
jgi:hypothetical protein